MEDKCAFPSRFSSRACPRKAGLSANQGTAIRGQLRTGHCAIDNGNTVRPSEHSEASMAGQSRIRKPGNRLG